MDKLYVFFLLFLSISTILTYRIERHCVDYIDNDGVDDFLQYYGSSDNVTFHLHMGNSVIHKMALEFDTPVDKEIEYCFDTKIIKYLEHDDFFRHTCDLFFPFDPNENPHILLQKMIQEYKNIKRNDNYDVFFEKQPDFCGDLENQLYENDDYICRNGSCDLIVDNYEDYLKKKHICDKGNFKNKLNKWLEELPFIYEDTITNHKSYTKYQKDVIDITTERNDYYDLYRFFEKKCFNYI